MTHLPDMLRGIVAALLYTTIGMVMFPIAL